MKKIKKEFIYLILCIISVIGSILSFVFLQKYIPEFFIYINNNWNSGFTGIENIDTCKIPLLKDYSIKAYNKYGKDFFNKDIKDSDDIKKYYYNITGEFNTRICINNRSNYFNTVLKKYTENNNFTECKFIDSLNNTSCETYGSHRMTGNYFKYTQLVFSQAPPCFDPRYYNFDITFNKTSYYYDKSKCPGGRVSKHYHLLNEKDTASITIENLLKFNNLNELKKTLDDEVLSQILYSYGRNYIGIKDECRNKPFRELNNVIEDKNNYIHSSIVWLGYISLIEIIFFLLFLNRFIVKYHNYANKIDSKNKEERRNMKEILPPYTKPVILILSLLMLAFHILVFTFLLNIKDYIDLFKDISCFEEEAGELIRPSVIFLILGRYTQMIVMAINAILAFKFGIKKGIKYAN